MRELSKMDQIPLKWNGFDHGIPMLAMWLDHGTNMALHGIYSGYTGNLVELRLRMMILTNLQLIKYVGSNFHSDFEHYFWR